jgi:N-acetylglutamate synthase-like GNAT family acetyltransferase
METIMPTCIVDARDKAQSLKAWLDDRLFEFNIEATGFAEWEQLCLVIDHENGDTVAALTGDIWGECCEVRQLWVAEPFGRRGHGRSLLQAAEAEARRHGCRRVVISTHSFQAPGFYARLGYRRVAIVEGQPEGHAKLTFTKELTSS